MAANVPSQVQDALNRARNEQQKFVLLAYVARKRAVSPHSSKVRSEDELVSRCYALGLNTLHTDLDLALTFAYLAAHSGNDLEKRCRNLSNAHKALDSVARISRRLALSNEDARQLEDKFTFVGRVLQLHAREHQKAT